MTTNNAINLTTAGVTGYDGAGTFNGSSLTQHSLLLGGADVHTINSLGVATDGQIPIGSSGADPVLANLTPGTGVSIVNAAGSITINASGGGLNWFDNSGSTIQANTGYTADSSSQSVYTLRVNQPYGSISAVVGLGTGGWLITQVAGVKIYFGSSSTTLGSGSLASTNQYDVVFLLSLDGAGTYEVINSIGNIIVV